MVDSKITNGCSVDGSSALAADSTVPYLRLVDGGLSGAAVRPQATSRELAHEGTNAPGRRSATPVLLGFVCVLVLVFAAWGAMSLYRASVVGAATATVSEQVVTVDPGEGLLAIAGEHPIKGLDERETANWISQRNGLANSMLVAGQRLVVPA